MEVKNSRPPLVPVADVGLSIIRTVPLYVGAEPVKDAFPIKIPASALGEPITTNFP